MGSSGSKEVLHTSKLILDVPKCKGLYDQTLCLGLGYSPTVNVIAEPDRDHGATLVTLEIGGEVVRRRGPCWNGACITICQ
jgi:hypothetical protein